MQRFLSNIIKRKMEEVVRKPWFEERIVKLIRKEIRDTRRYDNPLIETAKRN